MSSTGADASASATLSHLLHQYLSNLGRTAAFYSERFGRRWSANVRCNLRGSRYADELLQAIVMQTLAENALHNDREDPDPLVPLHRYFAQTVPAASKRMQNMTTQLQAVYAKELELAAAQQPYMPLQEADLGVNPGESEDQAGNL